MMDIPFIFKCARKRSELPQMECGFTDCPWFIHQYTYKNCFWVLAEEMSEEELHFTFSEIAELEGISEEEVERLYQSALKKVSKEVQDSQDFSNNS